MPELDPKMAADVKQKGGRLYVNLKLKLTEEERSKICRNVDREYTAGYLAIILGMFQLAIVISGIGDDSSVLWQLSDYYKKRYFFYSALAAMAL